MRNAVGVVDKAGRRVWSEGVLALTTLDFIGFTVPPNTQAQAALSSYASGGVSLGAIPSSIPGR